MVSLEIIKNIIPLNETDILIFSFCSMGIISFVSSFFTDPKSWGLMGWVVIQIKDSRDKWKDKYNKLKNE